MSKNEARLAATKAIKAAGLIYEAAAELRKIDPELSAAYITDAAKLESGCYDLVHHLQDVGGLA